MCLGFPSRLAAVQTCRKLHLLQDIFPSRFNPTTTPSSPRNPPGPGGQWETPPPPSDDLPALRPSPP